MPFEPEVNSRALGAIFSFFGFLEVCALWKACEEGKVLKGRGAIVRHMDEELFLGMCSQILQARTAAGQGASLSSAEVS